MVEAMGVAVRRLAPPRRAVVVALALALYGFLAVVAGLGVYSLVPGHRFIGRDSSRPNALPLGQMHDKELWFSVREIDAHRGDTAWLAAHEVRLAPVRQRVRDEQRAYLSIWALATGAGGAIVAVVVGVVLLPHRRG